MATEHDEGPRGSETGDDTVTGFEGRRSTLQDVARAAGVSVSAVSKVIRGAYGVSPQMRQRVEAAITALGYRPNAGARAMRGRSYTVGVVLVSLDTPFQPEVAQGISDELEPTPFQEVVVAAGTTSDGQKRRIEALLDRQVDGLVLIAPWLEPSWIEQVAQQVPVVCVALHGPSQHFDTVVDDEQLGTRAMVDYLVSIGHERIAHTSLADAAQVEAPFVLSHTARRRGFEDAMRRRGLPVDIVVTEYSEQGGYDAAMQLLERPERPTAIFAGADISAFGVLRAAEEQGLRVPEDLTVVGYDNIHASAITRVSLTTIDQSGQSTGAASARLLLERIGGRTTPARYVIAPRLIARGTSGPPSDAPMHRGQPKRADVPAGSFASDT